MQTANKSRHRGLASIAVVYLLGFIVTGVVGYKVLHWDPTKEDRVEAASKKLEESEAKLSAATAALNSARENERQHAQAAADDAREQTRAGQTWVAATGQALTGAPAGVRGDLHVSAALHANSVAAQALEGAVGKLTPAQAAEVLAFINDATSASEARRAQADAELADAKKQLAELAQARQQQEQLTRAAEAKVNTAQQAVSRAASVVGRTVAHLNATLSSNSDLGGLLEHFFYYLKLAIIFYIVAIYILPLLAHMFPGLAPLADVAHALLSPLAHTAKIQAEALARDASAATDELLSHIEEKAPGILAEARTKVSAWITEADGTRERYEKMLRTAHRR